MGESTVFFSHEYIILNLRSPVDVWIKWDFLRENVMSNPRSPVEVVNQLKIFCVSA